MHCPMQRLLPAVLLAFGAAPLGAQTIDDHLMMPRRQLCTGFVYMHDSWDRYWEGSLERGNGNVGTLTTQSVSWMGTYGVTDRRQRDRHGALGHDRGERGHGERHGRRAGPDRRREVERARHAPDERRRRCRRSWWPRGAFPSTDYTPDFLPMSIGLHSNRASGRLSLNFQAKQGWFVEGTGAYTWRDTVTLDRPAYFTDDRLFLTDQVAMPDVIDYTFRAGYWKHGVYAPLSFTQVITLGGSDIRRQDMPFVSNRMNSSRLDALVMVYLKKPRNFVVRLGASYAISGRNVGQSTTLVAGLLYTFKF